jgi:hypothetical protein
MKNRAEREKVLIIFYASFAGSILEPLGQGHRRPASGQMRPQV